MPVTTDVSPARTAEIIQRAADLIDKYGWSQEYLIDPTQGRQSDNRGALAMRGALAIAVGLPPLASYLFNCSLRHHVKRHEFAAAEKAIADVLAMPDVEDCECGGDHDNRGIRWETQDGRTETEVVTAMRRAASAQTDLACYDAGLGYDRDVDWDGFMSMLNDGQSSAGQGDAD